MLDWRCTVRTQSNYLQTVYVTAYNHSDAVIAAESRTGGDCIMAVPDSITSSDDNDDEDSTSSSSFDGAGLLFLLCLFFIAFAWKQILLIVAIAALIWGVIYTIRN